MESKPSSIFRGPKVSRKIQDVLKPDLQHVRQRIVLFSRFLSGNIKVAIQKNMSQ